MINIDVLYILVPLSCDIVIMGIAILLKLIEGLRAKRAYVGFWPIFNFLQDQANFSD